MKKNFSLETLLGCIALLGCTVLVAALVLSCALTSGVKDFNAAEADMASAAHWFISVQNGATSGLAPLPKRFADCQQTLSGTDSSDAQAMILMACETAIQNSASNWEKISYYYNGTAGKEYGDRAKIPDSWLTGYASEYYQDRFSGAEVEVWVNFKGEIFFQPRYGVVTCMEKPTGGYDCIPGEANCILIESGTLCGGPNDIPVGQYYQLLFQADTLYAIVEVNPDRLLSYTVPDGQIYTDLLEKLVPDPKMLWALGRSTMHVLGEDPLIIVRNK
ncbi:hypothetical protein A3K34_02675 [candidate division WWE3 bacterium RIFOXYC1_FULL_40_10]|uniref:Uncharacterized protein n=1 Tax=candidate division WWE3 bacterium RIFOXYA2_FULL_46_9 TaxID=1802636 RepID=A0A1F4W2T8_UNCKA|nr:MAG: hypothetical protein A3K58_02675 [candidate division WWE3 bacterium RIFOXYB1_FULL_40_22]OGC61751.1 MAG: hypothetical protein A3K37_02675 [candidate division WWE3 bacterium RIFOXYA1_FULL_40_11]OGC63734.1 MAG: hypothetical protein A2264_05165 [candidate division WWE3 bacterium RIFOXYA2_FULL_46_9]OGC65199.1 MAG: hypothetical protein A2326_02475 [candidate division WWE3 bacterium RIFOXYB2_FULL_41_6]OGC66134.1 MAG: hypothetical protein A3K34_02675 [candidate division WWE3 bacterium RIFOXYC1_